MEFYGACAHNRKWQIFYNLAMETLKKTYKSGTGWEMILQHKKYALIPIFHAASLLKKRR